MMFSRLATMVAVASLGVSHGGIFSAASDVESPGFTVEGGLFGNGVLSFDAEPSEGGYHLRVRDPIGLVEDVDLDVSQNPQVHLSEDLLNFKWEDGIYHWELRPNALLRSRPRTEEENAQVPLPPQEPVPVYSGTFAIMDGSVVDPTVPEPTEPEGRALQQQTTRDMVSGRYVRRAKEDIISHHRILDIQHLDDVIIDGSLCVGFDCVNDESFGFDTIRLKENNLRIKFDDTSSTASFPLNDWQITINDVSNGGANKYSIDDITGGRTPFTILAGAPTNSLYVDESGRVGLGTSQPVVELHMKDGNTPAVRLEQDGSYGWSAQTWDVAGNEANFFIRDVTNGSTLPFRIRPGAPTSSVDIAANGNVGIGTSGPDSKLHVNGDVLIGTETQDSNLRVKGNAKVEGDLNVTGAIVGLNASVLSSIPVVIAEGGTGGTTAADARVNLGVEEAGTANTAINAHLATENPHNVTAQQIGADPVGSATAAINAHLAKENPHNVTAEQVGADPKGSAATAIADHLAINNPHNITGTAAAAIAAHLAVENPHNVTAEQVGADPKGSAATAINAHLAEENPHNVTATLVGAELAGTAVAAINAHSAIENPHNVTCEQIGAEPEGMAAAAINAHMANENPHKVTCEQVGAEPAGTAAAVVDEHLSSWSKAGQVSAEGGNPGATLSVTFAAPYSVGTEYSVTFTPELNLAGLSTKRRRRLVKKAVVFYLMSPTETGFDIMIGGERNPALEKIFWTTHPITD